MRTPTSRAQAYDWHKYALQDAADGLRREISSEPECGWFQTRLVAGGPWVPVRIWLEQDIDADTGELADDERLCCTVNGEARDPAEVWLYCAGRPISRERFEYMEARRVWALYHAPDDPAARANRRVDWRKLELPEF